MNKIKLKEKATSLEEALNQYSGNHKDVLAVKDSTRKLLNLAKNELIDSPMDIDDIPGGYQWQISGISWPEDIRNAYYEFRIVLSGGLSDAAKEFLASRKK
jgi:hypothetical protein